jgi:TIR domain/Pentapeptide repeats (8 copies)
MANKDHVKLIREGPIAWNSWREENPDIAGDLSKASLVGAILFLAELNGTDLSGADLHRADLSGAQLRRTDLRGANLSEANLSAADLGYANLSAANLSAANLIEADFSNANLCGADLSDAFVGGADFSHANLSNVTLNRTDFAGAFFRSTTFAGNDLSTVKGLERAMHFGPSSIGIDNLFRSKGKIPVNFLREAGIPQDLIELIPSLVGTIEFYSCFISYSHQDQAFSQYLHARMRSEKLLVWYAAEDMKGGQKLRDQIFDAVQNYDKLLLVLSENSMKSEWVMTEIRRARRVEREENRRKLFPIRLADFDLIQNWECFDADGGKDLAVELREYYIRDFSNWKDSDAFEAEFTKLLRDLRVTEP